MLNNHIMYQKNTNFKIIPKLDSHTQLELEYFFTQLKSFYEKLGGFFWKLDSGECSIVVDDTNDEIASDFNNHLIKIIAWLYMRGYTVTGSFYFRNSDSIDYTKVKRSVIKNHIILDPLNQNKPEIAIWSDDSGESGESGEIGVTDTETKIKNYLEKMKIDKRNKYGSYVAHLRKKIGRLEKKMYSVQFNNVVDIVMYVCLFFTYTMLLYKTLT